MDWKEEFYCFCSMLKSHIAPLSSYLKPAYVYNSHILQQEGLAFALHWVTVLNLGCESKQKNKHKDGQKNKHQKAQLYHIQHQEQRHIAAPAASLHASDGL